MHKNVMRFANINLCTISIYCTLRVCNREKRYVGQEGSKAAGEISSCLIDKISGGFPSM